MTVPLWLDHVSVAVPVLAEAVEHLERRLGLHTTVTPSDPDHHGRVHLDRAYLEVAVHPGQVGWRASLFFLRFEDPSALRDHLEQAALPYRFTQYRGVDGVWDDVEILADGVTMPILVRRTAPPETARGWPPPLARPHPGPARTLASVHVGATDPPGAAHLYRRLFGLPEPASFDPGLRLRLGAGEVVLTPGPTGIAGIVLGVTSVAEMADFLGEPLEPSEDGVAWLDPELTFGLRLGCRQG
jgi:hypothetical protein